MADGFEQRVITLPYAPRAQFRQFHNRTQRWAILVCHRRAGKTVACINDLIRRALETTRKDARYAYLAPYHAQAKDVAWDYLTRYVGPIPGVSVNISELRVDLPNGARIRLYGAENAERMRGLYLDGLVIDEPADINPRVWPEILRPALADRQGWAVWIGTPKGKNSFWELWRDSEAAGWFRLMLKASETGLVGAEELSDARKAMSDDQYAQEFECSFDAAIQGAYYGVLMREAEEAGRIRKIDYQPELPVYTAWDLGIHDSTAIWFAQILGTEVRIIDFYESFGVALEHYAKQLKERPYIYAEHIFPHDAAVADLSTGKSRLQVLAELGIRGRVLERERSVEDGIQTVRRLLPRCWFNADKCGHGIEALKQYRSEYDPERKIFSPRPVHDWTSHAADAFRYLARGLPQTALEPRPRQRYSRRTVSDGSWMSA